MSATPLSLRLDPEIRERLQREAHAEDRSLSYIAQKAIISFFNAKDNKKQAIMEALAEADNGIFISDEAMTAWVESWGTDNELPIPEPDLHL
jgi:predicted transcriptional regulator